MLFCVRFLGPKLTLDADLDFTAEVDTMLSSLLRFLHTLCWQFDTFQ